MQAKLIGYQNRDTVIHRLSGAGKLLFFILVSLAAMISYDTRLLVLIAIFSVFLLYLSEIRFKDVSFVAVFSLSQSVEAPWRSRWYQSVLTS